MSNDFSQGKVWKNVINQAIPLMVALMTFSPILIETITEWIRRIYEKSLDREDENKGFFARFLAKFSSTENFATCMMLKYADCPRLHYAVCVMQINGLFLSAQPEASKCRDHNTFSFHLMS